MVEVGKYVYAKELKRHVKILDVVELWGYKIFLALDTSTNKLLKLNEENIELQIKIIFMNLNIFYIQLKLKMKYQMEYCRQ